VEGFVFNLLAPTALFARSKCKYEERKKLKMAIEMAIDVDSNWFLC